MGFVLNYAIKRKSMELVIGW